MINYLKTNVIFLKHLDQKIETPVIAGAGEAGGRKLTLVLTEEAAARLTPLTQIYLNWKHLDVPNLKGFNIFTQEEPIELSCGKLYPVWSIGWPAAMKQEGTVLANIVFLDEQSKDESNSFEIEILSDIAGSEDLMNEEDFSLFEEMLLKMNKQLDKIEKQQKQIETTLKKVEKLQEQLNQAQKNLETWQKAVDEEIDTLENEWLEFLEDLDNNYKYRIEKLEKQMYLWYSYHGLSYYPRFDTTNIIEPGLPEYDDWNYNGI